MKLKDPTLLRQLCYVDGDWKAADSGATIDVTDPATDDVLGTVPKFLGSETRVAIAAPGAPSPPGRRRRRASAPRSCGAGTT
jgi:succinate-semialdehyde dehydrogenase/glutarate-semialdehyde dehydrogenase